MERPPPPSLKPGLARPSPSFRLHSSSLNNVRLRRIFDLFDRNGDGEISVEELHGALDRLGLASDSAELSPLVSSYIRPGRGGLGFEDFQGLHRALGDALFGTAEGGGAGEEGSAEEEEDMLEAFKVFDEDGDGYISAKELQAVLGKLGLPEGESIDRVHQMIFSVDRNRDGLVDFREFQSMMQGITVKSS